MKENDSDEKIVEKILSFLSGLNRNIQLIEGKNAVVLDRLEKKYKTKEYTSLSEQKLIRDYYSDQRNLTTDVLNYLRNSRNMLATVLKLFQNKYVGDVDFARKAIKEPEENFLLGSKRKVEHFQDTLPIINKFDKHSLPASYYKKRWEKYYKNNLESLFERLRDYNYEAITDRNQFIISAFPNSEYQFVDPIQQDSIIYKVENPNGNEKNIKISVIYHSPDDQFTKVATYHYVVDGIYLGNIKLSPLYDNSRKLYQFRVSKNNDENMKAASIQNLNDDIVSSAVAAIKSSSKKKDENKMIDLNENKEVESESDNNIRMKKVIIQTKIIMETEGIIFMIIIFIQVVITQQTESFLAETKTKIIQRNKVKIREIS